MKEIIKDYIEDIKRLYEIYDNVFKALWYSDLLDPVYRAFNFPAKLLLYIQKFIYYGKVGASLYDFDANGVDELIYAHIKRVRKFMDSDKTHLVWNSERKRGLIRKLYEFEELCKRKCRYDDFDSHYYFRKELDKYGRGTCKEIIRNGKKYYTYEKTKEHKRKMSIARKKDKFISKQLRARYYELLSNYVAGFWD